MTLIQFLARFPRKIVSDGCNPSTGPLFTRYILFKLDKWFAVYIHQIHRSDNARDYHDHPWSFLSLIIKGEYTEHVPVPAPLAVRSGCKIDHQRRYRAWRQILFRPAKWKHYLELKEECWTICIRFGRDRLWGFHNPAKGFMPFNTYPCFEEDELGAGPRPNGVKFVQGKKVTLLP